MPDFPGLEFLSKGRSWKYWVKWLKQREKRGERILQLIPYELVKLKTFNGNNEKRDDREAGSGIPGLFGPLPRIREREERLSPSSENKWMFYLSEGPRMEALKAAEGRMTWARQTLEEIRTFSELKRNCEGHSKAVWSSGSR